MIYCQGELTDTNCGRDHHPRCYAVWMSWGTTDDFSYNVVDKPVPVYDLHATMLHLLGIDHRRLTFRFQGRDHRLTDAHGNVVPELLA